MSVPKQAKEVLAFWFEKSTLQGSPDSRWFQKSAEFDQILTQLFGQLLQSAAKGELSAWRTTPQGRLAEIIILDQFSRNIYRNSPNSFAQDPMALALAQEAVTHKLDQELTQYERMFLYMPFMHGESKLIQSQSLELFSHPELGIPFCVDFANQHRDIIERFGRYPHRNEILSRQSSAEEIEFLTGPNSSF